MYSADSLCTMMQSGRFCAMACVPKMEAATQCLRAVTNALSLFFPLVPRVFAATARGDEYLVDRRIKAHLRVTFGDSFSVAREQDGKFGVLKVADEIGHAKMTQIENRHDLQAPHLIQNGIGELEIIGIGAL
jgi:hypothetical protein